MLTIRNSSPAAAPLSPCSPVPATRTRKPSLAPAGILTSTVLASTPRDRSAREPLGQSIRPAPISWAEIVISYVGAAASPLIQKEFHLSDSEVGLLGAAFLLVYAVAAVPFGYWADRGVLKPVVAAGGATWSLATLFTGFARSFPQLVVDRRVRFRQNIFAERDTQCRIAI